MKAQEVLSVVCFNSICRYWLLPSVALSDIVLIAVHFLLGLQSKLIIKVCLVYKVITSQILFTKNINIFIDNFQHITK